MPTMYKGLRQQFTVRMRTDLAAKVLAAARARRWSVSEFLTWCAEQHV